MREWVSISKPDSHHGDHHEPETVEEQLEELIPIACLWRKVGAFIGPHQEAQQESDHQEREDNHKVGSALELTLDEERDIGLALILLADGAGLIISPFDVLLGESEQSVALEQTDSVAEPCQTDSYLPGHLGQLEMEVHKGGTDNHVNQAFYQETSEKT